MNFIKTIVLISVIFIAQSGFSQGTLDKAANDICVKIGQVDMNLSQEEKNKQLEKITVEVFTFYALDLVDEYNIDINDSEAAFGELAIEVTKKLTNNCEGFIQLVVKQTETPKRNKKTKSIIDKMTKEVCESIDEIDLDLSKADKVAELHVLIETVFLENYTDVLNAYEIQNPEESNLYEGIGVELGINLSRECEGFLEAFK